MILEVLWSVNDATAAAGMSPVSLRLEKGAPDPVFMESTLELIGSVRGSTILLEEQSPQWPVPSLVKKYLFIVIFTQPGKIYFTN